MGIPVLILGESGSGKSAAMRNFETGDVGIFNVTGKPLPFKKNLKKFDNASYNQILSSLKKNALKTYVIDDSQYLMAFFMLDRCNDKGYGKFTECAMDFINLVRFVTQHTTADTIVYFLHHTETLESGKVKAKTSGKMIDSQITLEGLFSIVLLAQSKDGKYIFTTQSDGFTTCKSPMEMFDIEIDNDLKAVDNTIREYWNLKNESEEKK